MEEYLPTEKEKRSEFRILSTFTLL
jgi:hypothetical protein